MTLAEIAATCPNWRDAILPARVYQHRGPCLDYKVDYQRRKARGISPHRLARKAAYNRAYRLRLKGTTS